LLGEDAWQAKLKKHHKLLTDVFCKVVVNQIAQMMLVVKRIKIGKLNEKKFLFLLMFLKASCFAQSSKLF
jgi:hypothetical protein